MKVRKNIVVILVLVAFVSALFFISRADFLKRQLGYKNIELDVNSYVAHENESAGKVLIIVDTSRDPLVAVSENINTVFQRMNFGVDIYPADRITKIDSRYTDIVLVVDKMASLQPYDDLISYVQEGGRLIIANPLKPDGAFNKHFRKFGIFEFGNMTSFAGTRMKEDLLLNQNGESFDIGYDHFGLLTSVDDQTEVYAESYSGQPLIWAREIGLGKVLYYNTNILDARLNQGLIFGGYSLFRETFAYPVYNSKVMYIDDFPSPLLRGNNPEIFRTYGRDLFSYFREIWWPDMVSIAKENNVIYTGVLIGSYQDKTGELTIGDFELSQLDLLYFSKELISADGELGVHGFNHQPLTTKPLEGIDYDYKPWKSTEDILNGLEIVNERINNKLPEYDINIYVPPSNVIDDEGIDILLESNLGIKVVASLFDNGTNEESYEQGFGVNEKGFIDFPRLSSGYFDNDETQWHIVNGITGYGIFSHFIHPDDLFDPERNKGMNWDELSHSFKGLMASVNEQYSWLRPMTASEGAYEILNDPSASSIILYEDNRVIISNQNVLSTMNFILRSTAEVDSIVGGKIERISEKAYLVMVDDEECIIEFKR